MSGCPMKYVIPWLLSLIIGSLLSLLFKDQLNYLYISTQPPDIEFLQIGQPE